MKLAVIILAACILTGAAAGGAAADTRRVVLVAGNNTGFGEDAPLRYAERDASRVADLFRQLGAADHVETLLGANARSVLASFQKLQKKIEVWKRGGDRIFFLFYYSGHGTERGLRMGGSELSTDVLLASLSLVGADVRFAVIDACESGTFTRTKGIRNKRKATVSLLDRLETSGEVVMASTSRGESAQESEALKGSFFTSYWLTGLRGAADRDGDGAVSITEAYGYAYDRTLVSTVITASGIQHPTFSTKLSGREDIVLTWPKAGGAHLRFKAHHAGTFLILSRDESTVLAEVPASKGASARIALQPGTYVVKKRGPDGLHVALVQLKRGIDAELDESEMRKVPYAVLVEKGDRHSNWLTMAAGFARPSHDLSSSLELEAGYMRAVGPIELWPTLSLAFGGGSGSGNQLDQLRGALAAVRIGQRPRWSAFYGGELSAPMYVQTIGDQRRVSAGFGFAAMAGSFFRISDQTEIAVRVAAGGELIRTQRTVMSAPASWKLVWKEAVRFGLRVRF